MVNREELVKQGILTGEPDYTPGALGVFLSHVEQWKTCVRTGEVMTVVEDDAIISEEFESCSQSLIESVGPDWDVIYWGWNFDAYLWVDLLPGVCPAVIETFQNLLRDRVECFQSQRIPRQLFKILHLFGMVCYSVTPRGAQAMLDFCLPLRPMLVSFRDFEVRVENNGVDYMLNAILPDLRGFVCMAPLVVTENRHENSTVRNER